MPVNIQWCNQYIPYIHPSVKVNMDSPSQPCSQRISTYRSMVVPVENRSLDLSIHTVWISPMMIWVCRQEREKEEEQPSYMLRIIYPGESKWAAVWCEFSLSSPLMLVLAKLSKGKSFSGVFFFRREGDMDWISIPQLATWPPPSVPFTSPRLVCCIKVLPGLSLPATCFVTALRILSLSLALCFCLWLCAARNPFIHSSFWRLLSFLHLLALWYGINLLSCQLSCLSWRHICPSCSSAPVQQRAMASSFEILGFPVSEKRGFSLWEVRRHRYFRRVSSSE